MGETAREMNLIHIHKTPARIENPAQLWKEGRSKKIGGRQPTLMLKVPCLSSPGKHF